MCDRGLTAASELRVMVQADQSMHGGKTARSTLQLLVQKGADTPPSHRQVLMVHHPNMSSPTSQVKLKLMFMSMFMLMESSSISILGVKVQVRVPVSRFGLAAFLHARTMGMYVLLL